MGMKEIEQNHIDAVHNPSTQQSAHPQWRHVPQITIDAVSSLGFDAMDGPPAVLQESHTNSNDPDTVGAPSSSQYNRQAMRSRVRSLRSASVDESRSRSRPQSHRESQTDKQGGKHNSKRVRAKKAQSTGNLQRCSDGAQGNLRPHACSNCDKRFKDNYVLKRHEQTHTGEKPFKCPHCKYAAKQKGNLEQHIRIVHDGIKKYQCSYCDYKSGYNSSLKRHERTHTHEKSFECPHCEYAANQKPYLKRHILIVHDGIKKYECSRCEFKTGYKCSLEGHGHTHTGDKLFKCSQCEYATNRKDHLKKHIKRKHSQ